MADVTLNSAVRSNLRTLQATTGILNETSERLSTGKKVNSALDNPSSFFTAQALDRRAGDLSTLLDGVSTSVKTLEAADNGIKAITDVVEGLKATARNALQAPKGVTAEVTGSGFAAGSLTAADLEINNVDITLATTDTLQSVVDKINEADAGVSASIDDGEIKLTSDDDIVIGGVITGTGFTAATTSARVTDLDAYEKRQGFLDDYNEALEQIDSLAKDASFNGVNLLQGDDLEITFNEDGSSKLDVKGASFTAAGIGLASLTESVIGAEGTSTTDPFNGPDTFTLTTAGDFDNKESINDVIDTIDSAFDTLESQASKFGSQLQIVQTRETFTKDQIGTLEDGALALTGADTNLEAANLATLQTRQSLIVSSLSISTQQESNILQLLR